MQKNNWIKKSFNQKSFKGGSYSIVMTIVLIGILLVTNLVAGQLNIKWDATEQQLYSLSDQTKNIVSNLQDKVNIYLVAQTGQENKDFTEILDRYKSLSSNINVEYKDPVLYPQFTTQYVTDGSTLAENSIIVESGKRFKVISYNDMINYQMDQTTYQYYVDSIDVEGKVTSAINYVTTDSLPTLYEITGHNEATLGSDVTDGISQENIDVKDLDLLTSDKVPDDASCILINAPQRDYSDDETTKVLNYLQAGGKALIISDYVESDMPNFRKILNTYGVEIVDGIVLEGNTDHYIQGHPTYLIPNKESHDIINPIKDNNLPIIIPFAQGLKVSDVKRNTLTIDSLLTTSDIAYSKTNVQSTVLEKEAGDIDGPFSVAMAITDQYNGTESRVVVVSTSAFLDSSVIQYSSGGNLDFLLNSLNWLNNQQDNISIRTKSVSTTYLNISAAKASFWAVVVVVFIPLIILILGFVTWIRRRKK